MEFIEKPEAFRCINKGNTKWFDVLEPKIKAGETGLYYFNSRGDNYDMFELYKFDKGDNLPYEGARRTDYNTIYISSEERLSLNKKAIIAPAPSCELYSTFHYIPLYPANTPYPLYRMNYDDLSEEWEERFIRRRLVNRENVWIDMSEWYWKYNGGICAIAYKKKGVDSVLYGLIYGNIFVQIPTEEHNSEQDKKILSKYKMVSNHYGACVERISDGTYLDWKEYEDVLRTEINPWVPVAFHLIEGEHCSSNFMHECPEPLYAFPPVWASDGIGVLVR